MEKNQLYLALNAGQQNTDVLDSIPGLEIASVYGTSIPDLPMLPTTLIHLKSLLSSDVVDLAALTNVVRCDLGLTISLLRIARNAGWTSKAVPRLSEIIVGLGIKPLKAIVAGIPVLSAQICSGPGIRACTRFWMHAQLTGLVSEELASSSSDLNPEDAYLAGLVSQIGKLPVLLGWRIPELESGDVVNFGSSLARAWGLPGLLTEVIEGDLRPTSVAAQSYRQIVTAAREWVQLLELVTDSDLERVSG
jgi:HD-like signal output (HDOD) protein